MKITILHISASGGSAPIIVNTAGMTAGRRAIVQAALDVLLDASPAGSSFSPDAAQYRIVVEEPGRLVTSFFVDDGSARSRRCVNAVTTIEMSGSPVSPG